jgi:predicted  nucleic acid-binding Zn-ribbon protein
MSENKDIVSGAEIMFADGKKRVIKPLTIRNLRKFMKVVKNLKSEDTLEDADIDIMVEAAAIALATVDPEVAADKEKLEDALDLRSFGLLMNAAMGSDPSF